MLLLMVQHVVCVQAQQGGPVQPQPIPASLPASKQAPSAQVSPNSSRSLFPCSDCRLFWNKAFQQPGHMQLRGSQASLQASKQAPSPDLLSSAPKF